MFLLKKQPDYMKSSTLLFTRINIVEWQLVHLLYIIENLVAAAFILA